jgi:hypothetical protein
MESKIKDIFNAISIGIQNYYNRLSKQIIKDYYRIKNKSFIENISDLLNYLFKYIYILVIIFVCLMILTFFTYSNAPIAVLFRKNLAFYKSKPISISQPTSILNDLQ